LFEYVRALELDDKNPETFYKVGQIHAGRGNLELARLAYQKAIELSKTHAGALEGLGLVLLQTRNYAQARELLTQAANRTVRWHPNRGHSRSEKDFRARRLALQAARVAPISRAAEQPRLSSIWALEGSPPGSLGKPQYRVVANLGLVEADRDSVRADSAFRRVVEVLTITTTYVSC
jgi:tetratricopeptide (TPR) repeat protein